MQVLTGMSRGAHSNVELGGELLPLRGRRSRRIARRRSARWERRTGAGRRRRLPLGTGAAALPALAGTLRTRIPRDARHDWASEGTGVPDPFAALGLTFDDVLLLPGETDVIPSEVDTTSR